MPRANQQSFNAGELSPLLSARTKFEKYGLGATAIERYIPTVQGPLTRTPGTHFVAEVKDSSKLTRLIPFEFSTTQAYVIEVGDLYMRFYKDNGIIVEADVTVSGITQANPAVVTATAHGYSNGDEIYLDSVVGMTEVNGKRFIVANVTANTFELTGIDSTGYTAYSSGGVANKIYEITTTYDELDVYDIQFVQSADVVYLVHPDYPPKKLSRTGHTAWTLTDISFLDGPYLDVNDTATTLTASAATGSVTVTASAVTGINNDTGFQATDVGRVIRMYDATSATNTWGWGTITAVGSTTSITVSIQEGTFDTVAQLEWRLGVWSDTDGWPSTVAFYEDRLFFAGAPAYPQRVDGSNSSDYEYFAPSVLLDASVTDSHSISATLNAKDLNRIWWLSDTDKGLIIGTHGGVWVLKSNENKDALSPTNARAEKALAKGSAYIQPVQVNNATLYVQKSQRKLREVTYSADRDSFVASDATVLAEHITAGGMVELAHQDDPQSLVWAVRADGLLIAMTYDILEGVVGWHKQPIGGYSDAGQTTGALVESISVIPSVNGDREEVWMLVNRYIDGGTKRYVEYIGKLWEVTDAQEDAFYVDSGLTYDGASTTTITGLDHLEGQTVAILGDGAVQQNKTVASGSVTLDIACTKAQIGLPYDSILETMDVELEGNTTTQSQLKNIKQVTLRFVDTLGVKVGPDADNLDTIIFRTASDPMGSPPGVFSGYKTIEFDGDYEQSSRVYIKQSQPYPGTINAMIVEFSVTDV